MLRNIVCGTVLAGLLAGSAMAGDRYATRPGVIISPDLTAPWVMQLSQPRLKIRRALPAPVTIERETIIGASVTTRRVKNRPLIEAQEPEPQSSNFITIGPDGLVQNASLPKTKKPKHGGTDPMFLPQEVAYDGGEAAGTIVIDTQQRFLFLVGEGGTARRYGVGVGKPGFEWAGEHKIARKAEWPVWTPPEEMKVRVLAKEGRVLPDQMEGGPDNPLGARAMYLGNSLYRIHGTNQPWTIGHAVSSGCIRMRNEDVVDLYERVKVGTRVIVM
jgi:lipoprotein-anchoring transpeptidase ErfK/SrfK